MTISEDSLYNLIADLYGTLSESTNWHEVLGRISAATGCPTVTLDIFSHFPQEIMFSAVYDMDREVDATYIMHYSQTDPKVSRAAQLGVRGTWHDRELLTLDEVRTSAVYQELWFPTGLVDQLHSFAGIGREAGVVLSYMGNNDGMGFDQEVVNFCNILLPHVERVARTQLRLTTIDIMQTTAAYALDSLAIGVILIGLDGCILHVNKIAETFFSANDGLVASSSGIKALHHDQEDILLRMVGDAIAISRGDKIAMDTDTAYVKRPSGKRPYTVRVTPVTLKARFIGQLSPGALVFVIDPERELNMREECFVGIYGLTRAEARLAVCLGSGLQLAEAAVRLGVRVGTARNQLKSIFQKTETHSQAELIALLLKMNVPK